jgi:putative transposase
MKYEFIQAHRFAFAVKKMCQVLSVSRSGYYDWFDRLESHRSKENKALVKEIETFIKKVVRLMGVLGLQTL